MRPITIAKFLGKDSTTSLAKQAIGTLTAASGTMVLADQNIRRAPGYTEVLTAAKLAACPGAGKVTGIFDFQRTVDAAQFLIVQRGTALFACTVAGTFIRSLATLVSPVECQFTTNAFICYLTNGTDALRLIDKAGTLTAYKWGIDKVIYTPTIAISAGTLTLIYGRRYVVCDVAKYTDSLGIERISVSAPSEMSAHTGPITDSVVTVGGLIPSTDPQVTHKWVFATADSPIDTSATFYFAAEIVKTDTAWADALLDTDLDQTRQAPFDNYPAPPSMIATEWQNRQVLIEKSQIRLSGGAEVLLGIPDEAFPLSLFFDLPGGARPANAAAVVKSGTVLAVSNGDAWFNYSGYDSTTFVEQDHAATPGACGRWAVATTPGGLMYLSPSKRQWVWSGDSSSQPVEMSANLANKLVGTVGMESINDTFLPEARVHWYSFGQRHFGLTASSVTTETALNWLAIWGVPLDGLKLKPNTLFQTDKFPLDSWNSSSNVGVNGVPYIYFGLSDGRICRFPDSFLDAGQPYDSAFSHAWIAPLEGHSRFYWVDLMVDVSDVDAAMQLGGPEQWMVMSATVLESPENTPLGTTATTLTLVRIPVPTGQSVFALRASLQLDSINSGRYIRLNLSLAPSIAEIPFDVSLQKMTLQVAAVYMGA